MNYTMMKDKIDFFYEKLNLINIRINNRITKELKTDFNTEELTKNNIASIIEDYEINKVDELKKNTPLLLKTFNRRIKNLKRGINTDFSLINSYTKSINTYKVELHKKFSIPFACIIFIIIGAPLGIMSKKGALGSSISISLLFFIIYWAFLIGGEELADRGFLDPALSMWLPNIVLGLVGIYLCQSIINEKKIL